MRKLAPALLFILLVLAVTQQLKAQNYAYATGSPSFSTQIPIEGGFINVNNGEIHLEIPLATHTQRGRLQLNESLIYDSRIWKIVNNGGSYSFQPTNVPNSMGGWRLSTPMPAAPTAPTYSWYIDRYGSCGPGQQQYPTEVQYWNFAWTDPQGTNHAFDAGFYQGLPIPCDSNQQPSGGAGYALDGSGYYMTMAYNPDTQGLDTVVYDRQGNQVYPALQDPNGNFMSMDGNGNLVDTLGRTPVLTSTNGNQIYYDVLSNGGARLRYLVTTETVNYATNFSQEAVADVNGSFTAIQSIQLPDGSSYSFAYDSYGELSSVILPTGGTIQYSYQNFVDSFNNSNRWLYQRIKDGGTTTFAPATISACTSDTGCQEQTTVTSPDGNDTVYTFTLDSGSISNSSSWNTGITAYQGAAAGGKALKSVSTSYTYGTTSSLLVTGTIYYTVPQTETVTTSLPDVGLTSQTVTTLDSIGANPTNVQMWDYYSGSVPSTPTKQINYKYVYSANGAWLPTQISVTDGSGTNIASQTNYHYDETTPTATTPGLPNHNSVSGPWGNLTSMSRWLNTTPGNPITTNYTVDDSGMVTNVKDPNGNSSSTTYQCSNSLPLQATNALSQTTTYTYDCNSGAITNVQDPNDAAAGRSGTAYAYEPVAGRLQSITHSGYSAGGQTTYSYPSPNETDTAVLATPDPTLTSQDIVDSFGRPYQHVQGGSSSETTYDSSGRVYCVTNPHFSTPSPTTDGSTCITSYDGLGRPLTQTQPDSNTLTWSYAGNTVTSTDENRNSWQRTSNAFNQLVSVVEPGGLLTTYSYDGLGNVSAITQNGAAVETARTRSFSYDSLSRLIQAYNPESGWICNGTTGGGAPNGSNCTSVYDANGNLKARTDARGITISYQYDALDRLTWKTYSNGDSPAQFVYDVLAWPGQPACDQSWVSQCNVIGRLSYAQTLNPKTGAVQTLDELSYDAEGRIWLKWQEPSSACGGACYSTLYRYDAAGQINQYRRGTYEAGVAPQLFLGDYIFTYDSAGRIQTIAESTDPNDPVSAQTVLFTANQYGSIGLTQATLGNGTSLNFGYNNRGWKNSISSTLSTGATAYSLGLSFYPNGNIQATADSINGSWSYTYDALNRLSTSSSSGQAFQYGYDSFGNRLNQTVTAGSGPQNSYTYTNGNNNRLDPSTGVTYDSAGNVTWDGFHRYSYDAEGRLSGVDGSTSYIYNAEGQRTAVLNGGAIVRQYLYDNVGRPTTVLDANGNLIRSELWAGGLHLADDIPDGSGGYTNNYIFSDHLGNLRAAYDSAENQLETRQLLPYGEEQNANGTDVDPLHFTGLERDQESNLDHAMYRQYSSTMGRWMSPDPYSGSMDIRYPQTLNRYAYVGNSPLTGIDPSGLNTQCSSSTLVNVDENGNPGNPVSAAAPPACNTKNDPGEWWDPFDWPSEIGGLFGGGPSFKGVVGSPRLNSSLSNQTNNPNDCASKKSEITKLALDIFFRLREYDEDYFQIPLTGGMSRAGHIQQIRDKQTQLNKLLKDYPSSCGGPPPMATDAATQSLPTLSPSKSTRTAPWLLMGGAAALQYLESAGALVLAF